MLFLPFTHEGNITILVIGTYMSTVRNLYAGPGAPLPPTRKNIIFPGAENTARENSAGCGDGNWNLIS
jgi:hypothetical protein